MKAYLVLFFYFFCKLDFSLSKLDFVNWTCISLHELEDPGLSELLVSELFSLSSFFLLIRSALGVLFCGFEFIETSIMEGWWSALTVQLTIISIHVNSNASQEGKNGSV
jgi:hypothetical protein